MKFKLGFLFLIFGNFLNAQELLTAEEAVAIALKNNYDIKIAANNVKIDEQNISLANAGLLPTLAATFVKNNAIQDSRQTQMDGSLRELNNAKNNRMEYGVGFDWTIFDGFRMFARYDQLKELQKLGEAQLKLTVLTKVGDVMSTYYDLVQQQQVLKAMDTAIVISQQRVTLEENRFTIGKASKLEVLNAQVDLNTDRTNYLRQKELYQNRKTVLNEILARDLYADFVVSDSARIDTKLELPDLISRSESQNPQIQMAVLNKRVAELNLRQIRGNRYPQVRVNTGYIITDTESSLGFARQSHGKGFNYGISASINIFNGFLQNRHEKIAKLEIENSAVVIEQQNQLVTSQLITAYQTYLTNLELVGLEEKNEQIAKQNLDITLEKHKIGTITTIEVRTAQLNYINAMTRNSNAKYQAKISEITLKELAGNITF